MSKRPQFDGGSGQFAIEYGTDDRKQISLDVNSEVNDKMAFRLQALGRKNGSRVDGVEAERIFIAPSLAYKFTDDTKITLLTSYQKDDSDPYLQFLPMEGTLTSNPNGKISDSTAVGNTDWETFEREQLSLGYEFEHHFNDSTYFMQNTRYSKMDINLRQMYSLVTLKTTAWVCMTLRTVRFYVGHQRKKAHRTHSTLITEWYIPLKQGL